MTGFRMRLRTCSRTRGPFYLIAVLVVAALALLPLAAGAQSTEWPSLFAQECGSCHGTARDLLNDHANIVDGVLVARDSGQALRDYLRRHFRERTREDIAAVHTELLRVAQGGGRFSSRCAICHESAKALARDSLILHDGRLQGRYSGRDIADYLQTHARIADIEEAAFFEDVLRRQIEQDH